MTRQLYFLMVAITLLASGCSEPALISAVSRQDKPAATRLLQAGANPDQKSRAGETSLHIALRVGNIDLFRQLLKYKANPNICDQNGASVVHRAAQQDDIAWLKLALQYGGDVDRINLGNRHFPGETPIYYAIHKGCVGCVEYLMQSGAALNHQDQRGETPLYAAFHAGMYKAAVSMLERGADPTIAMYGGASILTETILAEGNDVVIKDESERKELLELRAYLVDHGYLK